MKVLLILISILFLNNSNTLHKDSPLQVDNNGNIIGLPKEFVTAKFNLDEKYLRLNDKEIILPDCLAYYFTEHKKPNLNLFASWYHSKKVIPYYIGFDVSQLDIDYKYTILINLETLELIYIEKTIKEGNGWNLERIELDKQCKTEYKNGIKTLK